jgi:NAD(P) transhydrogenase subunit alpha
MNVGILKESDRERRVALLPEGVKTLTGLNVSVLVESAAGSDSYADDDAYKAAGASIVDKSVIMRDASVVIKINPPTSEEMSALKEETVLIAILQPFAYPSLIKELSQKNITSFSMDFIPRTTRAQAMDVLSSMATVAGYKAVLLAASHLPTFFPMFMTAAGTITPAKVLILGAGVAGLQAIATAKRLGAVVEAFDVRTAAREEVESLGAKFVEVEGAKDEESAGGYAVEQTKEFQQRQKQTIHDLSSSRPPRFPAKLPPS